MGSEGVIFSGFIRENIWKNPIFGQKFVDFWPFCENRLFDRKKYMGFLENRQKPCLSRGFLHFFFDFRDLAILGIV